jgi:hypothetical protein
MKTKTKPVVKSKAKSGISHLVTTRDGKPQSVSLVIRGKPYNLSATHQNFQGVLNELKKAAPDEKKIVALIDAQEALLEFSNKTVTVSGGGVYYKGNKIGGTVVTRLLEFMRTGLPYEPLLRFLQNLPDNERARDALYSFLENKGLTLTPDGCFLAYKGVRADYTSGYPNNLPSLKGPMVTRESGKYLRFKAGDKLRCDREDCDLNTSVECSKGIHVGSHDFAKGYTSNGHMMLVKVNPKDTVSIPHSHGEKVRVCAVEVLADLASPEAGVNGSELRGPYTNPKKLKRKLVVLQKRGGKKKRAQARKSKLARRNKSRNRKR